jgi:L-arabonate dehydrase
MPSDSKRELRSREWFHGSLYYNLARRTYLRAGGYTHDVFEGKPVIGICNSWSELNPCNMHLRTVAEAVKRGVWAAGGVPLEFPTISLGETFILPTAMLLRNLMAMDVEEMIRGNPLDGVVLLCGCDKTTPAQLMGAASVDIPTIMVPGGPMFAGNWRGQRIASGTDGRKLFDMYRAGTIGDEELNEIEGCVSRTLGHCTVMGTASTMTNLAEAMGMTLPGCAAIPAVDSRKMQIAEYSGRRIVEMVHEDLRPSMIMTRESMLNAVITCMALGGSTNAVVHLLAIARRLGFSLTLDDFDRLSRTTPYLANIKPSGQFLMEDFFHSGSLPALMNEILPLLHRDCLTVTGKTIEANVKGAQNYNTEVIHKLDNPISPEGGLAILRGNLAPEGAVIKPTAASPHLLHHRGKAYVFENHQQLEEQMNLDYLPVDANSILVMKNGGPKGAPGFPEWGWLPMPKMLLKQGITDVVRVSDSRMSGTSFGTVVLHVAPESAIGGPLAIVQTGDEITLDVPNRRIDLNIPVDEIERRLMKFTPPPPHYERGYGKLFLDHVTQAHEGCDFDFLQALPAKK